MQKTDISWTDYSANPLKYRRKSDGKVVWACVMTSPGCAHCYSQALALRWVRGKLYSAANMEELEPFLDEKELRSMLTYKPASSKRCFTCDMTDCFGEWVPDEMLDRLFAVFALRKDVVWQVLTKRAERMRDYLVSRSKSSKYWEAAARSMGWTLRWEHDGRSLSLCPFPLPGVHLGVSVEDQAHADERVPLLLQTPAAVRFLSVEPMLGPVEFSDVSRRADAVQQLGRQALDGIGWVIVGGESGPKARACPVEWIRSVAEQCVAADVPCFVKQASGPRPGMQGAIPDPIWALKQFPACAGEKPKEKK